MMYESRGYTFLLLKAVAGLLSVSGAGNRLKNVCPGDSVHVFENIKFNHCYGDVSLYINGDRNTKIAMWVIQNCTIDESLQPEYRGRVFFDQNGTITIHNFNYFDQAKYVVFSKMDPLPMIYEVNLYLMGAPTKKCKPIIEKLGNSLIASLIDNDCGKPVAIPYWKDYGAVSNTLQNTAILKLPPGKEANTYYACIDGPALKCAKDVQQQDYCSAFTVEGSNSSDRTVEIDNTPVMIVVSIVVGSLSIFILLIIVTQKLLQKMSRRNLNGKHNMPLVKEHPPDQEYNTEKKITKHQPSIELENMREFQDM